MGQGYTVAEASPAEIADEWCSVLAAGGQAYPFQHPAWHAAWWSTFTSEALPLLLAVREPGGRLAGVLPLMRSGDRLAFAGDPEICDYMDVLAAPEHRAGVYAALVNCLAALPWRELVLWGLPAGSPTLAALPALAAARGWSVRDESEAVCPRVALPATWDAYLDRLPKKDRHELRRKLRRFEEAGGDVHVVTLTAPEEVAPGLDDFLRLHTISRRDKRDFMTARMETFFREMAVSLARYGITQLLFVEAGGVRVAGLLTFDMGHDLLLYNSGYDPAYAHASVGLVSKALTLRAAIQEGKPGYDFLRGAEPYKYDLGATDIVVRSLIIGRDALA